MYIIPSHSSFAGGEGRDAYEIILATSWIQMRGWEQGFSEKEKETNVIRTRRLIASPSSLPPSLPASVLNTFRFVLSLSPFPFSPFALFPHMQVCLWVCGCVYVWRPNDKTVG